MAGFLIALPIGILAFWITTDALYAPKPIKPRPVTIPDVWSSIAEAQNTLDASLRMIYGDLP
ncbi:MAG: hypothetical protein A4E20_10740 [Nitrospira sp. SG-bin2]|nr:MAG: hypothetical protein A4E20_10740 [Nitrospira sp. SG-bin2]